MNNEIYQLQQEYEIQHEILAHESHTTKLSSQPSSRKDFINDINKQAIIRIYQGRSVTKKIVQK